MNSQSNRRKRWAVTHWESFSPQFCAGSNFFFNLRVDHHRKNSALSRLPTLHFRQISLSWDCHPSCSAIFINCHKRSSVETSIHERLRDSESYVQVAWSIVVVKSDDSILAFRIFQGIPPFYILVDLGVSKNMGKPPKTSILRWFSIIFTIHFGVGCHGSKVE